MNLLKKGINHTLFYTNSIQNAFLPKKHTGNDCIFPNFVKFEYVFIEKINFTSHCHKHKESNIVFTVLELMENDEDSKYNQCIYARNRSFLGD